MDWLERAVKLKFDDGVSWVKLPDMINSEFKLNLTYDQVRDKLRANPRYKQKEDVATLTLTNDSLINALKKGYTELELCEKFATTPRVIKAHISDLSDNGYQIINTDGVYKINKIVFITDNIHIKDWNGEQEFKFGVVSDTHGGARSEQITHLNDFYDRCQLEGVKDVYHAGDMIDGDNVYPGHQYHVHTFGADAQKDYVVKNYPKREGITTHYITGNHCLKNFTKTGYDVGNSIQSERKDMKYLGQYYARVYLTPKCILQIEHPLGQPSYAASYKIQRKIDNMSGGDKPAILVQGHFHYSCYVFRRNVHGLMLPSFQGPNDLSRRLGLECDMGGVIITVKVDKEGTIREFTPKFIPYLVPIVDDWKKYV